jgi:hypothetical protein
VEPQKIVKIYTPFSIDIDPMDRLLLINFGKDPDSIYMGFEPQVIKNNTQRESHLIIGWRIDGKVDVYHEASLNLDPEKYDIAGKGLGNMVKTEMEKANFEVNEFGVQAHYQFNDLYNRRVLIHINERSPFKTKPFALLAPMGQAAESPSAFPLILLHGFYFVRKRHTSAKVFIAGRHHQLDMLPLPMDWTRMYFTRYSTKPLIASFNPVFEGPLPYLEAKAGSAQITQGPYVYDLEWQQDLPGVKTITRSNEIHPIQIRFNPAFPELANMSGPIRLEGTFEIEGHPTSGKISGDYRVEKTKHQTKIVIEPSQGWKPRPSKFSLIFLYTFVSIFRSWPKSYKWTAILRQENKVDYFMRSKWKRVR